jgi:hypothetical protein
MIGARVVVVDVVEKELDHTKRRVADASVTPQKLMSPHRSAKSPAA